jgi:hypothetical protein
MSDADASLAIQKVVVETLKADAAVSAMVSARVYTRPPVGETKPYISLGPDTVLAELAAEYEGFRDEVSD